MGRYNHRPLHLFGGLGLVLTLVGIMVLVYLTVLKLTGHGIGQRPLLTLGVLFVVVGMQFFSLGLLSELITSHHEERGGGRTTHRRGRRQTLRLARLPRVRVLYFGTYERDYPRNAQVISCLRGAGVEVVEQHADVWEAPHTVVAGGRGGAGRTRRAPPARRRPRGASTR